MTNTSPTEAPLSRIPFTARAEASIRELSKWMRISGIIGMIAAVLKLVVLATMRNDVGQLVSAAVTFMVGFWSYQAAAAFAAVATTDTADQKNLMDGFGLLRRVFLLQAILVIMGLGFAILAVIVAVIFAGSR